MNISFIQHDYFRCFNLLRYISFRIWNVIQFSTECLLIKGHCIYFSLQPSEWNLVKYLWILTRCWQTIFQGSWVWFVFLTYKTPLNTGTTNSEEIVHSSLETTYPKSMHIQRMMPHQQICVSMTSVSMGRNYIMHYDLQSYLY
jgi:hypothetical protein